MCGASMLMHVAWWSVRSPPMRMHVPLLCLEETKLSVWFWVNVTLLDYRF